LKKNTAYFVETIAAESGQAMKPAPTFYEPRRIMSTVLRGKLRESYERIANIAAYNTLHDGRNENWQHVKVGQPAAIPIDFLVTLPDKARSFISLRPASGGNFDILSDGIPIGAISKSGVSLTLKPEPFGPGFARLGIIRVHATAGSDPGVTEINAHLNGGTSYKITVVVKQ
jgi:hypothetical protein